jgi:AraC family transcriptional activator of mtrCDE
MTNDSTHKLSTRDLEILISTLDVQFVWLSHCLVSRGYRLDMGGIDFPGIHYNIHGSGRLVVRGQYSVDLEPNTLIVVPPNSPFKIEVPDEQQMAEDLRTVSAMDVVRKKSEIYQFVAGDARHAQINLICGFFRASYGQITDLFGGLNEPIIEKFGPEEQIGSRLRLAVAEFLKHEVGADAMSAALLKQVIILLLRRSLASASVLVERFQILRDPRIARVFAAMAADPGNDHTIKSLAGIALMSRSAFVSTFSKILGKTPMATLRDLRMRHAAQLLKYSYLDISQVSQQSGYKSSTSFTRAFRDTYGKFPNDYRADFARPQT